MSGSKTTMAKLQSFFDWSFDDDFFPAEEFPPTFEFSYSYMDMPMTFDFPFETFDDVEFEPVVHMYDEGKAGFRLIEVEK